MAINIPIISDFTDAGIKNARIAFDNFKTKVSEADGAMGKFKAGAGAAMDAVKANALTFAAAAGTAIATFAVRSVNAFQDLALEADRFASATGIAVEDASRWLEVAGDMEVSSEAIQTSINKMNRTIAESPRALQSLGIELARTESGAIDANRTFLNVIQRLREIEDPAERARVGTQLLGRGWQEMSQLIQAGSSELTASLAAVSDAKVIDQQEVDRAKAFREAMDNFKDTLEDVSITLGGVLIPAFTAAVEAIKGTIDAVGALGSAMIDAGGAALGFSTSMGKSSDAVEEQGKSLYDLFPAMGELNTRLEYVDFRLADTRESTDNLTWSEQQLEEQTWALNDAWSALLAELDLESAFRDAAGALVELNQKAAEAFADPTKFDAYKDQQDQVIKKFAEIMGAMKLTSAEQNRVKFLVDTGNLEGALDLLNAFNEAAVTGRPVPKPTPFVLQRRALGGPVMDGVPYLVGERGPELFVPGQSGTIVPNNAMGGGTINVTVTSADPNEVVRALQTYVRQSGPVPVNTRTM